MEKDEPPRGGKALEREETIRDLEPSAGAEPPPEPFTEEEIKVFGEKLESWANGLPERERELLRVILLSASERQEDAEVTGYWAGLIGIAQQAIPTIRKVSGQKKYSNIVLK